MSLQVEKLEHNMAKLTIEVGEDEVEKALQAAYNKNKNKMSIPGFRKGKVPRQMLEKMYGPAVFYEDAANILIPNAYGKEVKESELEIVSQPDIDIVQIEKGKPFIFSAQVALKPEVVLGAYKGVSVPKTDLEVTEEEIIKEIDRERENNARTVAVLDRPVKDKDITLIDFEGFVDGTPFEGGKGENHSLTIGSHSFIDTFEEQLIGKQIGEKVEVHVTFPEEYHVKELAGKPAMFQVTIKEIKEKELPELDDEFASEVSEFETLEEYKGDIREKILKRKEENAKREKEDAVLQAIIDQATMDIPEAMIETQARQSVEDYVGRLSSQGLSIDQYFQFTGLNMEKFLAQMRPMAEQRIKGGLVLEAVVKAENIEPTEEELQEELKRMAEAYHMEEENVNDFIDEELKKQIKKDMAMKKAVEFIVEHAVEE
ncbi:trigger factor [bacterium 1XD42-8]|nr:trigger factor [bacterium 1XD42-8]